MANNALPFPKFYDENKADEVYRVPYEIRANQAIEWRTEHSIQAADEDQFRTCLVLIDVQNTFCIPEFELFVGGTSGRGAIEDNQRLSQFMYRNLGQISQITATMDSHLPIQIFHAAYLVNQNGEHPAPNTMVSVEDVKNGVWQFNPHAAGTLGITAEQGQAHLLYYVEQLAAKGKYQLNIWPYHAMLGGIGHAIVSIIEEAIFFHSIVRTSQPEYILKGENPATEHYSAISPEVVQTVDGKLISSRNYRLLEKVKEFDRVVIAGQAKSHCVAATVGDLLEDILKEDPRLAEKVYLLDDCASSVVIPSVIDFSPQAEAAYAKFEAAGMKRITSDYVF
jgi:nicotinamidase-related amidase